MPTKPPPGSGIVPSSSSAIKKVDDVLGDAPTSQALAEQKREFIETFFKRGAEFTEELIHENERLRYRLLEHEQRERTEPHRPDDAPAARSADAEALDLTALRGRVQKLEREREEILSRVRGVEEQNKDYQSRYQAIERENNNLANLYVASHQLHSTLELREVTQIIVEILLNFIGAKTFAIQLLDEQRGVLRTLASEGVDRSAVPERHLAEPGTSKLPGTDPIADAVRTGKAFFVTGPLEARDVSKAPVACVPLKLGDRVLGLISVWELLSHKTGLEDVDFELFNLLGAHAGSALTSAKLNAELEGRPLALWVAADLV